MEIKHTAIRAGRLSSFLKEEMAMSTGLVNKLKWQNKIFVNGRPVKASYDVKVGDVLEITFGQRLLKVRVKDVKEYTAKNDAALLYEVVE